MVYLVQFESAFATKEEAYAFANAVEQIKAKCLVDTRESVFSLSRKLQVWESTHDEPVPKPCKLIVDGKFDEPVTEYKIDGVVPKLSISEVKK